jgi:hypothetical protein
MISRNETWPIVLFFVVAFACRIIFEWGFFASVGAGLAISFLVYVLVWRKRERERCVAQPAAPSWPLLHAAARDGEEGVSGRGLVRDPTVPVWSPIPPSCETTGAE